MKAAPVLLLFLITGLIDVSCGHRILGVYGIHVRSHFVLFNQLFKGLASKGHQVDVVSPFPIKETHPNYTQVVQFSDSAESVNLLTFKSIITFSRTRNMSLIGAFGYEACRNMGHPKFLDLARNPPNDPPYDVIITHMFSYHCFMILGHLWNIPVVLVSTSSPYSWMHDMIGNPETPAFTPNNLIPIPDGDSFWTRYWNTYNFYYSKFSFLYYTTNQNELLQKYFGPDTPSIRELERNVALVLVNTYFPINGVKPMTTGMVEVGGLHIQNEGPNLTDSLKKWLDESKNGFIYFNLGSILRIETYPEEIVKIIFKSLENLAPIRVLMRIAKPEELTVKIPSNFYTSPWIPQEKVLQHPNIKLFITHGGLLGTQESIFYGVPMLCLPVMADQFTNSQNYVQKKIAAMIDVLSITHEKFDKAITEIVNNPIYRDNVKKLSRMFRDRPTSPMDTAAFWIEFVIRNGKDSLRSPAMDLTWWQLALLDVFAVTLIGLAIIIYTSIFLIKSILRFIFCRKNKTVLKQKKNN